MMFYSKLGSFISFNFSERLKKPDSHSEGLHHSACYTLVIVIMPSYQSCACLRSIREWYIIFSLSVSHWNKLSFKIQMTLLVWSASLQTTEKWSLTKGAENKLLHAYFFYYSSATECNLHQTPTSTAAKSCYKSYTPSPCYWKANEYSLFAFHMK